MDNRNEFFPDGGMKVCLEIIVATLSGQSALRYSVARHDVSDMADDPDQLVMDFLQNPKVNQPKIPADHCIIHSTSWRYEANRTVVLTYIVYSDSTIFHNGSCKVLSLLETHIPEGSTPARPRPTHIAESHVVWHGILHISHLVQRDEKMRKMLTASTLLAFQSMDSTLAGRIC
jgi:hypothetical protein